MSSPWIATRPDVGRRSPARRRNRDDLPEPFGPIKPRVSPGATLSDTSETMDLRFTPQCRFSATMLMPAASPGRG